METGEKHIPGLDSVNAGNASAAVILAFAWRAASVAILFFAAWCLYVYIAVLLPTYSQSMIGLGTIAVLLFAFYPRFLLPDLRWSTDGLGLGERSLFRRRSIAWEDLVYCKTRRRRGCVYYDLRSARHRIRIPVRLMGLEVNSRLAASVHQHLRRFRTVDSLELEEVADSFRCPVPDDVRHEVEWCNPRPVPTWRTRLADAVIALSIGLMFLSAFIDHNLMWVIYPLGLIVGVAVALRPSVHIPRRAAVRPNHLEVEDRNARTAAVPWSEIRRAEWGLGCLFLWSEGYRSEICIPYTEGKASAELVLAAVRNLRLSGRAICLPGRLLQWYAGRQDEDSVMI